MPIQESPSVCKHLSREECQTCPKISMTREEALLRLRQKEVLAYHYLCETFRAQGHLTPDKLKLLKDVAAALYIPEERHRAECCMAVGSDELNEIADCVAGPGTDIEWRKESVERLPVVNHSKVNSASLALADAVAAAVAADLQRLVEADDDTVVKKTIKLKSSLFDKDFVEREKAKKPKDSKQELKIKNEDEEKEDEKDDAQDGDTSSTISSASDDLQPRQEEETKPEVQKTEMTKEETDASLMPPPPPVVVIPSPKHPSTTAPLSPPPPVITVPPPPPVITVPPPPPVITVPPPPPVITVPPPSDLTVVAAPTTALEIPVVTPVEPPALSEEEQARADFLSSLPPLVVVPPPDPSETASLHSPAPQSPQLVLSPGMSLQIGETKKRKRSVSQSQDAGVAKTVAITSFSKMTPVMVTAAAGSNQGQVKVTPIISRAKMATTSQAQKVIIVSNAPTSNTQVLQRSLSVPMGSLGLPILRANQPRLQTIAAPNTSGGTVRPKMVTVPAKCRAKGSNMVNLQLKNAITLKQDNVTVVDTNVKRLQGPTKILPKPSGSMFIVNTGHGAHKLATAVGGAREGGKQNVVIVQKGANQRTLTLSNPNKDLMQKLMSKKCVVIQSSKVVPKNISPKLAAPPPPSQPPPPTPPPPPPQPPQSQASPVITTAGNTVVLDLSQEQYRQNLGGSTVRDILQAAGVIFQPTTTLSEATPVSSAEGDWLPVGTSKSLSLEEVSLPLGQSESFVTLDEAVEMLEEQGTEGLAVSEGSSFTPVSSEPVFTITPDQLNSGNLAVVADKPEAMPSQIVIESLPTEVASDQDGVTQSFIPHKDGAVTVSAVHSNIDVPTNMSLEDYSSQQLENQSFN